MLTTALQSVEYLQSLGIQNLMDCLCCAGVPLLRRCAFVAPVTGCLCCAGDRLQQLQVTYAVIPGMNKIVSNRCESINQSINLRGWRPWRPVRVE
jgi:hypothetical protein